MKTKTLLTFAVAVMASVMSFAQTATFMVQGHERPDIQEFAMTAYAAEEGDAAEQTFTFDQITYWVGTGEKRAALVVDWYDSDNKLDHAIVWGYRFDGEATGYDMVAAIAKADPRFTFLTHNTGALGNTICGLGFDLNGSMDTKIIYTDPDTGEETEYIPANGIVTTQAYNYDDWSCSDPADLWRSGWYTGYWSYQVKDDAADDFTYSGLGATSRKLVDGSWDGWSYADLSGASGSMPRAPFEAVSRPEKEPTDENTYWGQTFKNPEHQSIVDVPLAIKAENLTEKWKEKLVSGMWGSTGSPIVAGDYVYIVADKKLKKYSALTGELVAESPLQGSVGFFSFMAYGDGKLFVPQSSGLIQAFDAVTLKSLWIAQTEDKGQHLCYVTYHDGYIYTGTWKNRGTGVYYCVSTGDDDPEQENEVKEFTWKTADAGYYWAGGTIIGDHIFVGNDLGQMLSLNRLTGEVKDTWIIAPDLPNSTIRCGTSYDEKTGRLFFTGKEAKKIYSVKINADGTFNEESKLSADVAGEPTTVPTVYNGRVYATSGTMTSGGGLDVFNAETLEKIYSVDMGGISQSAPVVCSAYANEANHNTVYIYVCLNNNTGDVVCIKDFEGNTTPIVQFKWNASTTQYCTHSLVVDQYGTVYYKNDSGHLFALESAFNVEGITLDRTEMTITLDGQFHPIMALVTPSFADNKQVTWTSSNPEVATVDENSRVMPVAVGTTTITATTVDGGFTATCIVTVTNETTGVETVAYKNSIYPNPVGDELNVSCDENTVMYMFNDCGLLMYSARLSAGANVLNVSHLPAGTYIVSCGNEVQKVIKL